MKLLFSGLLILFAAFAFAQDWQSASGGRIPPGAMPAGREADGTPLYVIRAPFSGGIHIGKANPNHSSGYIPWGGKENPVTDFEAYTGGGQWVAGEAGSLPEGAIAGGREQNGDPLYIIRARVEGGLQPGKFNPVYGKGYIPYGGQELEVQSFEILVAAAESGRTAGAPAKNWLVNPGAEVQPVTSRGWRRVAGDWSKARGDDDGKIGTREGRNFFWAGAEARGELVQDVALAAQRSWLADGRKSALLSGHLGSWSKDKDTARMVLEALDSAGRVLRSADTGAKNYDRWTEERLELDLPAATATLRVRLLAARAAGKDNNGYFDDLRLELNEPAGRQAAAAGPPPRPVANPGPAMAQAAQVPVPNPIINPLPQPPREVPSDRPAKASAIQTYMGFSARLEELNAGDGVRKGSYTDSYEYKAVAGEWMTITVVKLRREEGFVPRLIIAGPDGREQNINPDRSGQSRFEATVGQAGTYTIHVWTDDPAQLGKYQLYLTGRGAEYVGKLQPGGKTTREGFPYDDFSLRPTQPGFYMVELFADDFAARLTIRDEGPKDLAKGQGPGHPGKGEPNSTAVFFVGPDGVNKPVRAVIESADPSSLGGNWKARVSYQGAGS